MVTVGVSTMLHTSKRLAPPSSVRAGGLQRHVSLMPLSSRQHVSLLVAATHHLGLLAVQRCTGVTPWCTPCSFGRMCSDVPVFHALSQQYVYHSISAPNRFCWHDATLVLEPVVCGSLWRPWCPQSCVTKKPEKKKKGKAASQ